VQAGVVEEVVEVLLTWTIGRLVDPAGRDRLPGQPVVDDNGDPVLGPGFDHVRDICLERGVAPLVLDHLGIVDPCDRPVRGGVEAQDDALPKARRHADLRLVPDVAHMVMYRRVGEQVVEAGGHRHLPGPRQRTLPPTFGSPCSIAVEGETPQAVQRLTLSGRCVAGFQHVLARAPFSKFRCRCGTCSPPR
jgi:hypothetical protein